ncbi:MAG: TIR domain-containing protein [Geminicoccaceae bacterium]
MPAGAGYDVFLSYSRADAVAADQLRTRLAAAGLKTFLDRYSLPGGKPWQPELETALGDCRALVVLLGPAGIGGWQHREIQLGLIRQGTVEKTAIPFPVIPVLLPSLQPDDVPLGTFLNLNTWIDLRPGLDEPEALQRLLAAAQGHAIDGLTRDLAGLRPYRGLLPFREQDAGLYFGRQRFVDELVAKVRQRSATNVVAVLGRSGSGKSSIVFAGLFPALRQERGTGQQAIWNIISLRPGSRPLQALVEVFDPPAAGLGEMETLAALNRRADLLRKGEVTLAQLVTRRIGQDQGSTRQLLYVDQWEELYTQAQKQVADDEADNVGVADARRFVDLVLNAAAKSPCTLVLSVRSDFYPDLQSHDRLRAAVQDCQVSLGPMSAVELTAAIEGPARAVGGSVESELTGRLLRDIGLDPGRPQSDYYDIGKLPLLEYALEQAWTMAERGRIGLAHYRGLEQALEERANRIFDRLSPEQQAAAKSLFVSLVTPGEGREDTRARITLDPDSDLAAAAEAFADRNARLIVTGDDAGGRMVEVSHEALIRHWERLRVWIDENRANLRIRSDLGADRTEWLKHGQRADLLIPSGLRLETARKLRDEPGAVRIKDLLDYIEASEKAELAAQAKLVADRDAQHQRDLDTARQIADQQRERANAESRAATEQRQRAEAEARAADEQRQRAEAEISRSKTLRRTAVLVGIAAALAVGLAAYAWSAKTDAQQRADETTAALIWSRLDFEHTDDPKSTATVRALWDLADSKTAVRDAFLRQLALDRSQVVTLVSAPASIMRAFGLRPHDEDIERLVGPVLDAIRQSTDLGQIAVLAEAVRTIGAMPEQAQAALGPVLDAIRQTTNPHQLQALVEAVQAFGPKLTPEQAQAALGPVLDAFRQTTDSYNLLAMAQAVQTLGAAPEQAQAALGLVLDAFRQTTDSHNLLAMAQAVQTLGVTPEQAQAALGPVLDAIRQTIDPGQLASLAEAVQILGATPEQAQAALGLVLDAFRQTTDSYNLLAMAQAVQTLGATPEQAQAALGPVLDTFRQTTSPYQLQALAQAVQTLGPTPEQAQAALGHVLDAIRQTTDADPLQALAEAVQTLGPKLAPEQAQAALGHVLDAIRQTTDDDRLQALTQAVQTLGPKLAPEQAQAALGPVLDTIRQTIDPDQLAPLAQAVQALGPRLTPEQAQVALGPVLDAIRQSTDPFQLQALAQAIQILGPTPEQAQAALGPVLDAIRQTTNPYQIQALAQAVQTLGAKLAAEQAQAALGHVLDAIRLEAIRQTTDSRYLQSIRQTIDSRYLQEMAQAVQTLGPVLRMEGRATAIEVARTVLADTDEPPVAEAFARAISVTLPAEPAKTYVTAIVELLKWPTSAGPATDALLEALHERMPGVPGKEAGLAATVAWVDANYPDIDLDSPPTYPASGSTGGAW